MTAEQAPRRPLVLFVMAALEASGAESMLLSLAPLLQRDGITGVILSTGERGIGSYAETLATAGYRIEHLPFSRSPTFMYAFWRLCRDLRPSAVHIHCERANFWFALAARLAAPHTRIVRTVHAVFAFSGALRWRRWLQRAVLRQLVGVVSVAHSTAVEQVEKQRFGNPVQIVPPWIDFQRFSPVSEEDRQDARSWFGISGDETVLAVVGSCQPVKNHDLLFDALADGAPEGRYIVLHAGTGPCEADERRHASMLGLDPKIRFLGQVGEVRQVLAASDLFVMPSEREGFGLAALEALACGVPALLSAGSGLESFSQFGRAVSWCQPERAALAGQLHRLLSMPGHQLRELADQAPGLASRLFGAEKSWQRHKELYALQGSQDISCCVGP